MYFETIKDILLLGDFFGLSNAFMTSQMVQPITCNEGHKRQLHRNRHNNNNDNYRNNIK